jgi:hypothetical protein
MIKGEMGEEQYRIFRTLQSVSHFYGIQMRMPVELEY